MVVINLYNENKKKLSQESLIILILTLIMLIILIGILVIEMTKYHRFYNI